MGRRKLSFLARSARSPRRSPGAPRGKRCQAVLSYVKVVPRQPHAIFSSVCITGYE